ncbi:MAG TPA: Hpt domain-containing protein [Polyangiaceae bacterium]|jgi:two-component system chemotaxis sensor kinase CheA
MKTLLDVLVLPRQITDFERSYVKRVNRVGLAFFALHLPVFVVVAYFNHTGPLSAVLLTLGVLAGPAIAYFSLENPRAVALVYGFASMLMGGLLVHFGQGPMQIEMHFYFFALLAMLAVYGNPLVILTAALTVALHHLAVWLYVPRSVFNYDASAWVVLVHASFVVLESIATCAIARAFFDNVIGLEKIVQARTGELDARNRDLRLVLDTVDQGFLTIDRRGVMSSERSAVLTQWLGRAGEGELFADYLERVAPAAAAIFRLAWDEVIADVLPLEVALDQLPCRFALGSLSFRLDYKPILRADSLEKALIVISDVTSRVERERLEREQQEVLRIFERLTSDRAGFLEYYDEASEQIAALAGDGVKDVSLLKRLVHTLKGNSLLFGIDTVADACHQMESRLVDDGERPSREALEWLVARWQRLRDHLEALLGKRAQGKIEIEDAEFDATLRAVLRGEPKHEIARRLAAWRLEPTLRRLERIAEQAQGIARRLNKAPIHVQIEAGELRLDAARWRPFWAAFVHVVRNGIDHGLESAEERRLADKPSEGRLAFATRVERDEFVVAISDDGRGINWPALAERAKAQGLPYETQAELSESMFADGVSTAAQVTEISGRGIGMGAARDACLALSGRMIVASEAGKGTRVEFRFPRRLMAEDPTGRLAA